MYRIHKQQQAEQDLIEIWMYSCGNWGTRQADNYLDQLDQAFQIIASKPEIGIKIDYIRSGYLKYLVKEHIIFYTIQKSTIHIMRVLGNEMDYIQHL
jgi:toxin ParE1/3/4